MKECNFLYNREDELIEYLETGGNGDVNIYHSLKDKKFYKKNVLGDKRKIVFTNDCFLTHQFIDGEGWVRPNEYGKKEYEIPKKEIDLIGDIPFAYKLKKENLEKWKNLLQSKSPA